MSVHEGLDAGIKLVAGLVLAIIVIGVALIYGPSPYAEPCAPGDVVEQCKPALRIGWDRGPVVYSDRACTRTCRR